jgi:hypothetical protein
MALASVPVAGVWAVQVSGVAAVLAVVLVGVTVMPRPRMAVAVVDQVVVLVAALAL